MKTITTVLITIILILIGHFVTAQENFKGDTIRIQLDGIMLEVSAFDLKVNTIQSAHIPDKVKALLKELENVEITEAKPNERVVIKVEDRYSYGESAYQTLEFEKQLVTKSEAVLFQGQKLLKGNSNYVLVIENQNYLISIFLDKLEDASKLLEPGIEEQLNQADANIPQNRKLTNGWLILDENKNFLPYFLDETSSITSDMLELSGGIGSGWIKNTFVTDLHARVGLAFGKKAMLRNVYFTKYELMYDFSAGTSDKPFQTNSFLSLGWEHNMSSNPEKENWIGLSFGYLVDRNGDFFEKNTFKFGFTKRINNVISINPELYLGKKGAYPGVRFSIGF